MFYKNNVINLFAPYYPAQTPSWRMKFVLEMAKREDVLLHFDH